MYGPGDHGPMTMDAGTCLLMLAQPGMGMMHGGFFINKTVTTH